MRATSSGRVDRPTSSGRFALDPDAIRTLVAERDAVDWSLLDGFRFRCRPACGLCCYAEPRVTPDESRELLRIVAELPLIDDPEGQRIASRGDGGACEFLARSRCQVHDARPSPCRRFPIHLHIGARLQATTVLSCPGLDLENRTPRGSGGRSRATALGLEAEMDATRAALQEVPWRRWVEENERRWRIVRRRFDRLGRWVEPEEIEGALAPRRLELALRGFPPAAPPDASLGLSALPIYRDEAIGIVAFGDHIGGWEMRRLPEDGASSEVLSVVPVPAKPPPIEDTALALLSDYLGLLLRRDLTYWAAAESLRSGAIGGLLEIVERDLIEFGGLVIARAMAIGSLHGRATDRLGAPQIAEGIRATDAEFLDRPTLGRAL